jgi:uncharacterized membrane protein
MAKKRGKGAAFSKKLTYRPSQFSDLAPVLERNIDTLHRRRQREGEAESWQQRAANGIAGFIGSMMFVYLQLLFVSVWITANLGVMPGIRPWDQSFVVLAMVASVEAIFLSTFVLITQKRMAVAADKRADLDLQISLLTEHEITKLTTLPHGSSDIDCGLFKFLNHAQMLLQMRERSRCPAL